MRKLRRLIALAVGALIALCVFLLLGVNLYVQSQGAQAKIQQELTRSLGVPLKIRSMSVTPWGGLELSGITIAQKSTGESKNFLEAQTFQLRVRFLSIFSHRLVIKEVSLIKPRVIWPQNAEGKWRLPSTEPTAVRAISKLPVPAISETPSQPGLVETKASSVVSAGSGMSSPPPAMKTNPPAREPKLAVAPQVQRVSIKDGDFTFLDQTGRLLASFTGLDFRTNIRSAQALQGDAKVTKISLQNRFFLQDFRSPLRYEPDVLELSQISARVANGDVSGYFAMQPEAGDSPFTTSVTFHDVLADQLIENAGGPKEMVKGKLEGDFQASGKMGNPEALLGKGEIFLREGRVEQYRLLVLLGQILQIEELQELHLEQAEAKYHLAPGLVILDELTLRSPNIRLTASGTVAFDGALRLNSQLAINDRIRGQLFKTIRDNFHRIDDPGYSAIEFQVGGTIERPSTNLMEQLVGRDISSMLNSFFGGKKEKLKKKKKPIEAAVPVAPSPPVTQEQALSGATATPSPVPSP